MVKGTRLTIASNVWWNIVLGDFNLHYPLWSTHDAIEQDSEAEELFQLLDEHRLTLLPPQGTITHDSGRTRTTIDLVFTTADVVESRIYCGTKEEIHHDSDHLPVVTAIEAELHSPPARERRQWQKTDWNALMGDVQA